MIKYVLIMKNSQMHCYKKHYGRYVNFVNLPQHSPIDRNCPAILLLKFKIHNNNDKNCKIFIVITCPIQNSTLHSGYIL